MRPDRVVVASPALDDDLGLAQSVEDLAVEQLIAKAGVEALDVAVLPGAAALDVSGLGTDSRDPFLHGLGDELRSVVGPDVSGDAPQDEEVGQNVDHIDRLELAGNTDRQAFMGELVEHVEHPILASIVGAVLDKVVGPDMIAVLRPQPNARSVGQPEPAALGLLMGNLQPLTLPDTLDPLVVDYPTRLAQELGDLAIAIAAVLPGKLDNIGCETLLVLTTARDLALCRAMLPERRTRATLGHAAALGPAQCRHGDARGLEVSPGSLLQNELIQRQIGNRLAQPAVLELKVLQALHLFGLQPTELHLAHADLADCVHHVLALRDQNIHLPQLRDDLFRLVSLPCHYSPP